MPATFYLMQNVFWFTATAASLTVTSCLPFTVLKLAKACFGHSVCKDRHFWIIRHQKIDFSAMMHLILVSLCAMPPIL